MAQAPQQYLDFADFPIQVDTYNSFCFKFRCHGNRGHPGVNLNDAVKLAVPENHTLEPKSTVKIGPTGASIGAWKKRKK